MLETYGGCYPGGEVGYYIDALPDKLYKLDYVPVEVRSRYDPYTAWAEQGYVTEGKGDLTLKISYICLLISAVLAIITFFMYKRAKGENAHSSK